MGLAGFNRARRSRLAVEEASAERFKKWREQHSPQNVVADRKRGEDDEVREHIRDLEAEASKEIGEKVIQGIKEGDEGGIIDRPLRQDHAAEIAGRQLENNQEPKDPVARVRERVAEGSATEEMVMHTQVDKDGPPAELVREATLERVPEADRETKAKELDAEVKRQEAARDAVAAGREARGLTSEGGPVDADAPGSGDTADNKAKPAPAKATAAKTAEKKEAEAKLPAAGKSAGAGTETSTSSATKAAASKPAATAKPAPKPTAKK